MGVGHQCKRKQLSVLLVEEDEVEEAAGGTLQVLEIPEEDFVTEFP